MRKTFASTFGFPSLLVSILSNCFNLYNVFSLTQNDRIHLFLACFPVKIFHCALYIGWFGYVIAFCFTAVDVSSKPLRIFLVFIFSYCILDSFMIILLLTSILCKTKTLTSFLCKYWFVREVLVLLMSCLLICFYSYLLGSGHVSVLNILFFILFLTQTIILLIYMKLTYFKPSSWEPKPLEAKLPEKKMITDAFLIKAAMDEERIESAGAA